MSNVLGDTTRQQILALGPAEHGPCATHQTLTGITIIQGP